ncbi:4-hydroxythreonine-4-phosphate dehydrogenase PdxA [candidate division WOR-3 bacterium]|nr:4-hydroxythreonine-4-phosphate dehydrogenase PdxA [candidate division WOR-3 bacterium]
MKIGITMGDPSGIGPEITLKALNELKNIPAIIIGSKSIINEAKKRFNIPWTGKVVNCMYLKKEDISYGKPSELTGKAAYTSILKGYELIKNKEIDALVTAPICKSSMNLAGFKFPGHTELLAKLSHTKRFAMMLCGNTLRVVLVTTHVPLKKVSNLLTKEQIIEKIELTNDFLSVRLGIQSPKIGVCALNPHGGEGIFGDEETKIINPAVEEANKNGINAEGPYPSDTLFSQKFDAIIAMYHDQGMIPIKLKEFGHAVNITLGLPFVRTSPDHGTAFDIAGKGIADPSSMIQAIKLAKKLTNG